MPSFAIATTRLLRTSHRVKFLAHSLSEAGWAAFIDASTCSRGGFDGIWTRLLICDRYSMLFGESFSQLQLCGLRFENLDIFKGLWSWIILQHNGHFSFSLRRHHHGFRVGPLSITILGCGFFGRTAWPFFAFFWRSIIQNDFQRDLIVWHLFFLVHRLVSGYVSGFPRSPFRWLGLLTCSLLAF